MATRKAKTPSAEFTCGRFEFKSAEQLKFLNDVMERNQLTVEDIEARFDSTKTFPSALGFRVLDALRQDERDASFQEKVGMEPTENQIDALTYYRGKALESGRKKLAQDLLNLSENIVDRAQVSLAMALCRRLWPKDSTPDAPAEINTAEGFGDEDFGGK